MNIEKLATIDYSYPVIYGGRGGAKSLSLVDYLIVKSFEDKNCQYLCAREIQNSLLASVFLSIQKKDLRPWF